MDLPGVDRRSLSGEEARLLAVEIELQHVKTEVSEVKACLSTIDGKLDKALLDKADWDAVNKLSSQVSTKADTAELDKLHNRLPLWATWAFTSMGGIVGALVTALFFLAQHFKP